MTAAAAAMIVLWSLPPVVDTIAIGDIPTFRFTCRSTNSLDPGTPPARGLPPLPSPPSTPCSPSCSAGQVCTDGLCCRGLVGVYRPLCAGSASAYAFVLGGRGDAVLGQWYNPVTWSSVSVASGDGWGRWSAEFNATVANATLAKVKAATAVLFLDHLSRALTRYV